MKQNDMAIAKAFYTAVSEKNIESLEKHVHPDIQFVAPLAKLQGKEAYLEALKGFTTFLKTLTIRGIFGDGDQVVVVYDVDFPGLIGKVASVALMTFQKELITKIELFYDARPFEK